MLLLCGAKTLDIFPAVSSSSSPTLPPFDPSSWQPRSSPPRRPLLPRAHFTPRQSASRRLRHRRLTVCTGSILQNSPRLVFLHYCPPLCSRPFAVLSYQYYFVTKILYHIFIGTGYFKAVRNHTEVRDHARANSPPHSGGCCDAGSHGIPRTQTTA